MITICYRALFELKGEWKKKARWEKMVKSEIV